MIMLDELVQDPEQLLSLPVEELAIILLRHLAMQQKQSGAGKLHLRNFMLGFTNRPENVRQALAEAWGWLERDLALTTCPKSGTGWFIVSRHGRDLLNSESSPPHAGFDKSLPREFLHSLIEQVSWPAFNRKEYDSAVMQAFKQLEVAIRDAGGYPDSVIGVDLARKAFHPESGHLTDFDCVIAERQARSDLMAGAIGSYKNPHSHRNVDITDPKEAAEAIIMASHLVKIVESRKPVEFAETA